MVCECSAGSGWLWLMVADGGCWWLAVVDRAVLWSRVLLGVQTGAGVAAFLAVFAVSGAQKAQANSTRHRVCITTVL